MAVVVAAGACVAGGFSLFRLGARRSRSLSFSFSLSDGSGGIILRFPLTTLPTVPAVLPFAPVAVRAGLDSRSLLVVTVAGGSAVVRPLLVVVLVVLWPNKRLLLLGAAESGAAILDCEACPEMVRLCPPLVFLIPASVGTALSCGSDDVVCCPRNAGCRNRSDGSACWPARARREGANGGWSWLTPPTRPSMSTSSSKEVPLLLAVGVSHSDRGAFSPFVNAVLLLALGSAKTTPSCSPDDLVLKGSFEGVKPFAWAKLVC